MYNIFQENGCIEQRAAKWAIWPAIERLEPMTLKFKRHELIRLTTSDFYPVDRHVGLVVQVFCNNVESGLLAKVYENI